jgi:hypothetical protein
MKNQIDHWVHKSYVQDLMNLGYMCSSWTGDMPFVRATMSWGDWFAFQDLYKHGHLPGRVPILFDRPPNGNKAFHDQFDKYFKGER